MSRDNQTEWDALKARIVRLEELITHQHHWVQQLNDVITQQQSTLDQTVKRLRLQLERIEWLTENRSESGPVPLEDEKPPHY